MPEDVWKAISLYVRTTNLEDNENAEDIATDIMNLEISIKKKRKTVVVSATIV